MEQTPSVHLHVQGLGECSSSRYHSSCCYRAVTYSEGPAEILAERHAHGFVEGSDEHLDGSPAECPSYSSVDSPAISPVVTLAVTPPVLDVLGEGTVA